MTVAEYIEAVLGIGHREQQALDDLGWDQNKGFIRPENRRAWSVADVKANLSEILRLARAGQPQTIGTEEPCVVVSAAQFAQMGQPDHLGRFLIESAPRGSELELPLRQGDRDDPLVALIAQPPPSRSMVLATRNGRDFERLDVSLYDPWRD
jgi:antitoxin (DNA-binding transcriptional repressor) of toxin-antitoxin stability system